MPIFLKIFATHCLLIQGTLPNEAGNAAVELFMALLYGVGPSKFIFGSLIWQSPLNEKTVSGQDFQENGLLSAPRSVQDRPRVGRHGSFEVEGL